MSLLNGYLRGHADDCAEFVGWVGDDFWYADMILDPVPGYPRDATITDLGRCCI